MSKTVPSQDSVHCSGKYCTKFVHPSHAHCCRTCGAYLCYECACVKGYCEDCTDVGTPIVVEVVQEEEVHPLLREDYVKETAEKDFDRLYYEDAAGLMTNFTPAELKEMEDGWKFMDKIRGEPINLAVEYRKITENPEEYPHIKTIDDFFDEYDVPELARTDFVVASIFKQVKEAIDADLAEEHAKLSTENIDPDSPAVNPAYDLKEETDA